MRKKKSELWLLTPIAVLFKKQFVLVYTVNFTTAGCIWLYMEDIHHIHWLLYYGKHSLCGCKRDPIGIGELRPSSDKHRAFSDIYKHSVCIHCKDMAIETHIHYDCISHTKRRLYCKQCILTGLGKMAVAGIYYHLCARSLSHFFARSSMCSSSSKWSNASNFFL